MSGRQGSVALFLRSLPTVCVPHTNHVPHPRFKTIAPGRLRCSRTARQVQQRGSLAKLHRIPLQHLQSAGFKRMMGVLSARPSTSGCSDLGTTPALGIELSRWALMHLACPFWHPHFGCRPGHLHMCEDEAISSRFNPGARNHNIP